MNRYLVQIVHEDTMELLETIEIDIHEQSDIDSLTSPLGAREIAEQIQSEIQRHFDREWS